MTKPLPDYQNLDLSGEAQQAAARMEARSHEPASQEMFNYLIAPLLTAQVGTILEFGCGTAALSRRVARAAAHAVVYASDKSAGMLQAAQQLIETEQIGNIRLQVWDVLDEGPDPFPNVQFDLILSSVVVPYLEDAQIRALIKRLSSRLSLGGVLAFLEQDLSTDTVNDPNAGFFRGILTRNLREQMRSLALGLRPVLREAGLQVLPRRSFLWTDDAYGPYTRDLLERFADAAVDRGAIKPEESEAWKKTLEDLAASGDFYYGMVYHLVAGRSV